MTNSGLKGLNKKNRGGSSSGAHSTRHSNCDPILKFLIGKVGIDPNFSNVRIDSNFSSRKMRS